MTKPPLRLPFKNKAYYIMKNEKNAIVILTYDKLLCKIEKDYEQRR